MENKGFYAWDLVLILFVTIITVMFILTPFLSVTIPRTILGLFLIIFIPGYALTAVLFPKTGDLKSLERLIVSVGLSIAITPIIGLILNYTTYGIQLNSILLLLSSLTVLLIFVAYWRRRLVKPENRFSVDFTGSVKNLFSKFSKESRVGKLSSVFLIVSVLLALSATMYVIFEPKEEIESFTEFYILGPGGVASEYPVYLTSGEKSNLTIGIVNHERKPTTYNLVVTSDGIVQINQQITLNDQQTLQIPFTFTAGQPGTREMNFNLYKLPDNTDVYRNLHLWLNVTA
ncbi:MAG: DUF1616 domain-containing protein [Methanobacterium sp.]